MSAYNELDMAAGAVAGTLTGDLDKALAATANDGEEPPPSVPADLAAWCAKIDAEFDSIRSANDEAQRALDDLQRRGREIIDTNNKKIASSRTRISHLVQEAMTELAREKEFSAAVRKINDDLISANAKVMIAARDAADLAVGHTAALDHEIHLATRDRSLEKSPDIKPNPGKIERAVANERRVQAARLHAKMEAKDEPADDREERPGVIVRIGGLFHRIVSTALFTRQVLRRTEDAEPATPLIGPARRVAVPVVYDSAA